MTKVGSVLNMSTKARPKLSDEAAPVNTTPHVKNAEDIACMPWTNASLATCQRTTLPTFFTMLEQPPFVLSCI